MGDEALIDLADQARLERLASGDLSAEERAELHARAEGSTALGAAVEAFEQRDAKRMLADYQRLMDAFGARSPEEEKSPRAATVEAKPVAPAPTASRWRPWALAAAGLAAAAALMVFVLSHTEPTDPLPEEPSPDHIAVSLPALPPYEMEVVAPRRMMSPSASAAAPAVQVGPDGELVVAFRPKTATGGSLGVRAFVSQAARTRAAQVEWSVAGTGAIHVSAAVRDLVGAWIGEVALVLFVGYPEALPAATTADLSSAWAAPSGSELGHWQRFDLSLRVELPEERLDVQASGCLDVTRGPRCLLGDERTLRLWAPVSAAREVDVMADGRELHAKREEVSQGTRLTVEIPRDARQLEVRVRKRASLGRWTLAVGEPELCNVVTAAQDLRRKRAFQDAWTALDAARSSAEPRCLGRIDGIRARIAKDLGRLAESVKLLRAAIARHVREGRVRERVFDSVMLAFLLREHMGDLTGAAAALDGLSATFHDYPDARVRVRYHEALLALELGELRQARRLLDEAASQHARLPASGYNVEIAQTRAQALHRMGRTADAAAEMRRLVDGLPAKGPVCPRALATVNLGWYLLSAERSGQPLAGPEHTASVLARAVASYDPATGCDDAYQRANALLNSALHAFMQADVDGSARLLAASQESYGEFDAHLAGWRLDLKARIALARGHAKEALELARELTTRAERVGDLGSAWRGLVVQAAVLEARGDDSDAIALLRRAEEVVGRDAARIPIGEGAQAFLSGRDRSARALVDLLVRQERFEEAWEAARRARVRGITTQLDSARIDALSDSERQAWRAALDQHASIVHGLTREAAEDMKRPADALEALSRKRVAMVDRAMTALDDAFRVLRPSESAPWHPSPVRDGVVRLLWFPVEDGWVGFAEDASGVVAARIPAADTAGPKAPLASALFGPFAERIRSAREVEVLPYGAIREVDVHALPFDGDVLLASVPVVYGLDLLPRHAAERAAGDRRVVVVADPGGDLPYAGRSIAALGRRLEGMPGVTLELRSGPEETSLREVAARIPGAALFHFVGHGAARLPGGEHSRARTSWESQLGLGGGTVMTPAEVLNLDRPPAAAVLYGCDTSPQPVGTTEDMSVAHAFLARGTRSILGTSRVVDSRHAPELTRLLYLQWAELQPEQLGAALREAALRLRVTRPKADWAAFRVLVP